MSLTTIRLDQRWHALTAHIPVPQLGVLPNNVFLALSSEPLLVDTGCAVHREELFSSLAQYLKINTLQWIWISHADPDHTGNLQALLAAAPHARILTSFLCAGKLAMLGIAMERIEIIQPDTIRQIGDLRVAIQRPPLFDAPETLGFTELNSGITYAVDAFGAVLPSAVADCSALDPQILSQGIVTWAGIDVPWLELTNQSALELHIAQWGTKCRRLLAAHLPAVAFYDELLLRAILQARTTALNATVPHVASALSA